jgi:hypothetical protein
MFTNNFNNSSTITNSVTLKNNNQLTNNNPSGSSAAQGAGSSSPPQSNGAASANRLQFNRLATERKTVHVMNSNLNKDLKQRQQLLNNFNNNNHQSAAYTSIGTAGMPSGILNGVSNANTLQNYNDLGGNQSSLDYTLSGRSHTNASSFLQKLSSKFIRR